MTVNTDPWQSPGMIWSYASLVDRLLAIPAEVRLVAIDGPGGSGKSTFAARLATAAAGSPVIHTDDFASWDVPIEWWPRFAAQVIEPFVSGGEAHYQRYDWGDRQLAEWITVPRSPIIILEGVSSSRLAWRSHLAFSVWIDTAPDTRLRRGLDRDGDDLLPQWRTWMAGEDAHFAVDGARAAADIRVAGAPDAAHDPDTEFVTIA